MSHLPERTEKTCLNCNAALHGRFCHVCGQENTIPHESFWSLARHFIYDVFHFDGNFFHTLKYIFTRPGFVPLQYTQGKRASYLHPIRMYLFTSAVFFIVFSYTNNNPLSQTDIHQPLTTQKRLSMAKEYQGILAQHPSDSNIKKNIALLLDTTHVFTVADLIKSNNIKTNLPQNKTNDLSIQQYDSAQRVLPDSAKDDWFNQIFTHKKIQLKEKYKDNDKELLKELWEAFIHRLPIMLFLSLPFFAGILKLLYLRRKNFFYSDHAIFTLYHYIFSFILLLLVFGLAGLNNLLNFTPITWLITAIFFAWPVYLFLEMKNFYRQGKGKTFLKFFLLNLMGIFVLLILFIIFLLFSLFQL